MFTVQLHFHGDLAGFLPRKSRRSAEIDRVLNEKTAVKDVVEACGVPHTEVDLIVIRTMDADPQAVDFTWPAQESVELDIHAAPAPAGLLPDAARLQTRRSARFVADGHLGTLARNLRLLGLDTAYERDANDQRLLEIMATENRALLTRDRRLLMHSVVRTGYCPRSADPMEQTREMLRRFALSDGAPELMPYCRCLQCNGLLEPVPKAEVRQALAGEPLTLRFYDEFHKCSQCGQIYWPGTHFEKLAARIASILH